MSTTDAVKPVRKFPPPCWTRDEALVLIEAYRERWYALHRAFLRNPDWDAVVHKVTTSCPDVTPPKTPAQCRHKMEKLRQRHRAEKQRAASFPPGHFFSSWFYFDAMESMENNNSSEIVNGIPISDHRSLNPGRGIRFKPSGVNNLVTLAANSRVSISNQNQNWSNQEDDNEDGQHLVDSIINEIIHPPYKKHGIRIKPQFLSQQEPESRKFSKVAVKVSRNNNNINNNKCGGGLKKKKKKKRGECGINEVVASIRLLGDGFMKMEKMKIDMVREIERMRMETEMKRNQLMLDSQKQIVEVFVKGLVESKKRSRAETETMVG